MTRERALVIAGGCRIYGDWLARWVAEIALQAAAEGAAEGRAKWETEDLMPLIDIVVEREREACAKIAECMSNLWWNDYKGRGPNPSRRADPQFQGMSDGASDVAAKIRERGKAT